MFGMFGGKPNYEKIFSSKNDTYNLIYGNRSKTSSILGDNVFIDAWLSSKNTGQVTAVIESEASKGDIPSLKQMIWLCELYFEDAPNSFKDPNQLLKFQTTYMQDRIKYCRKAIDCGLKDQAYYAMTSSAKLYNLYSRVPNAMDNQVVQLAVLGIVHYGQMFLESGTRDPQLIKDTKDILQHYTPMAKIAAQFAGR